MFWTGWVRFEDFWEKFYLPGKSAGDLFWGCEKVTLSKDVADPQLGEKVWSLWITWQVVFGEFLLRPNPIEGQVNLNCLDFATQFVKTILLNDCFNN